MNELHLFIDRSTQYMKHKSVRPPDSQYDYWFSKKLWNSTGVQVYQSFSTVSKVVKTCFKKDTKIYSEFYFVSGKLSQ